MTYLEINSPWMHHDTCAEALGYSIEAKDLHCKEGVAPFGWQGYGENFNQCPGQDHCEPRLIKIYIARAMTRLS